MKFILLIVTIVLVYGGCTSDKFEPSHKFSGRVLDFSSQEPIENASVKLATGKLNNNIYEDINFENQTGLDSNGYPLPDSPANNIDHWFIDGGHYLENSRYFHTTSSSSGEYSFKFTDDSRTYYVLTASKPGYLFIKNSFFPMVIPEDDVFGDLFMDKASILKIKFHKNQQTTIGDSVYYCASFTASSGPLINVQNHYHNSIIVNGTDVEFVDSFSLKQFPISVISFSIYNNGVIKSISDSIVQITEFGTSEIEINY